MKNETAALLFSGTDGIRVGFENGRLEINTPVLEIHVDGNEGSLQGKNVRWTFAQPEAILDFLSHLLASEYKFYVNLSAIEQFGNILWIPVQENANLHRLHQMLDQQLQQHFGIAQHQFDREFRFHSTLFMDPDSEKIRKLHGLLKGTPLPENLAIDTFLLGISPDGSPGSYQVVRIIKFS